MQLHTEIRRDAARAGVEVGWLSVVAVLLALALGTTARAEAAVIALTVVAAVANGGVALLWARLPRHGRLLADVWTGGLVGYATVLVLVAGAEGTWDLLWFAIAPFVTVVHRDGRRIAWLAVTATSFAASMALAPDPLPLGVVALHATLLCGSVVLAARLSALVRRQSELRAEATARAELEQTLLAEAHHRVKNSLQTISDLLVLGRPDEGGEAFDRTAERIRSIAAVHHLLATGGTTQAVAADELLRAVLAASPAPGADLHAEPVRLSAAAAQQLGIAANELVANAVEHGSEPVRVDFHADADAGDLVLRVSDGGPHTPLAAGSAAPGGAGRAAGADGRGAAATGTAVAPRVGDGGLGLLLVRRVAEHGLGGGFTLRPGDAGTVAELRVPA